MNRRELIKSLAGAIATVAIGMRVSQGMPELAEQFEHRVYKMGFSITREDIEDGTHYRETTKRRLEALMTNKQHQVIRVLNETYSPDKDHVVMTEWHYGEPCLLG